ncbi:hypothetical protein SAMN05444487_1062 [Marininema mesophilum]|uniref:Uncharacterized protein n=1 Tax=Marininema mesophilum TaxID=1048340 RepID=A0A1H2W3X4_9BACL|nr:hypothetical protein [Marininema mesophilum]SDW74954.1 hypothetical protein SAMN05444487_1062 [Marininema mesophilum]
MKYCKLILKCLVVKIPVNVAHGGPVTGVSPKYVDKNSPAIG